MSLASLKLIMLTSEDELVPETVFSKRLVKT